MLAKAEWEKRNDNDDNDNDDDDDEALGFWSSDNNIAESATGRRTLPPAYTPYIARYTGDRAERATGNNGYRRCRSNGGGCGGGSSNVNVGSNGDGGESGAVD